MDPVIGVKGLLREHCYLKDRFCLKCLPIVFFILKYVKYIRLVVLQNLIVY